MVRARAGNSRGLSGWRSSSGERGAAFLLPGPGGGVGHREGRAARVGGGPPRQPAAAGPRQAASADDAAAPPQPPGKPRAPQRPRSRPPPPGRLRLLPSHTPRAARAAGLPGAPPSLHTATRVLLPLACLAASGLIPLPSPPQALLSHIHTRARALACWAAPCSSTFLTLTVL